MRNDTNRPTLKGEITCRKWENLAKSRLKISKRPCHW